MDKNLLEKWGESLPDNFGKVLEGRLLAESARWLRTCRLSKKTKNEIRQRLTKLRQKLLATQKEES